MAEGGFRGEGLVDRELRESEPPNFLSPEQIARFKQLSTEVYQESPEQLVGVNFSELGPGAQEQVVKLEEEYTEQALAIRENTAKRKLQFLDKAMEAVKRVAKFLDLDTREKIMSAALEVVPYIGLAYAVFGRRVRIDRDEDTGEYSVGLEKLSILDRVIYLAGEVMVSGHALRGALNSIQREGLKKVLVPAAKKVAENTGQLLVRQAKLGVQRELGIDVDGLLPGRSEVDLDR